MIKARIYKLVKAAYAAHGHYYARLFGRRMRLDSDYMEFWRSLRRGLWEPETITLLDKVLRPDDVYCDVGAWIGPTVLCAATKCKAVYCFEPDRFAYESLLKNIRLNAMTNVVPFHVALSDSDGLVDMASRGNLGDTMTSLLADKTGKQIITVPCISWDTFLATFRPPVMDVLKIDTEGAEFMLIPAMSEYLAEHRPVLYLSTHAPFLTEETRLLRLQQLIEVLRVYDRCATANLVPATHDVLLSQETLEAYPAYLFFDSKKRPDLC
jgi:FkbM family methyltransferase